MTMLGAAARVVLWAFAAGAVAFLAMSVPGAWSWLRPATLGVAVISAAGAAISPRWTVAGILSTAYLLPAILALRLNAAPAADQLFLTALAGLVLGSGPRLQWSAPPRWRLALGAWALAVALTAPVVAWRELDFFVRPLAELGIRNVVLLRWIVQTALAAIVGVLWFDWLFAAFGRDERRFRAFVVAPLAVSWVVSTAIGIFQATIDFQFLTGFWAGYRRSTGGMMDANPFGMIAALWGGIMAAAALRGERPHTTLALGGLLLSWTGVWISGSRSSLAVSMILSIVVLALLFRRGFLPPRRRTQMLAAFGVGVAVLAVAIGARSSATSPFARVARSMPELSVRSARNVAAELWYRGDYGYLATRMIRDYPVAGVGIGTFHTLVGDYAGSRPVPPDNAQNWFRHQLAEVGLAGSAGWIVWVGLFLALLVRGRTDDEARRPAVVILKVVIGLFGVASLVGVPAQNTFVAVTFWALAYWYVALVSPARPDHASVGRQSLIEGAAVALVVATALGVSIYTARESLRPPLRALRHGIGYNNGFYTEMIGPDGLPFRWTKRQASAILDTHGRWVLLTIWVEDKDLGTEPVDVRVWCNGTRVIRTRLRTTKPVFAWVELPPDTKRIHIETSASRYVHPPDAPPDDRRDLGMLIKWEWRDIPP